MDRLFIYFLCCFFATLLVSVGSLHISEGLRVTLKHGGSLIGRHMMSTHGRYVLAFLGIPYAKPPLADLRFRAPQPLDPWEGDKMATAEGNICSQFQITNETRTYSGDEDCLYLNIYVPQEPKTKEPLPVIVYIHGGGFVTGSGSVNALTFLNKDIILVSINYRLSTLGFLSSETLDVPGNFGLKDQLLAMKWVKEHISSFGGDDNSITIYGESAGSVSVTYHTLSEKSKGVFNRVIASSGTYYNNWGKPAPKGHAANQARKIAETVGCPVQQGSWEKTLKCLRTVPAKTLTEASINLLVWYILPLARVPVVVEPEHEDAFLTEYPKITEYSNSMPIMMGFNKDEGMNYLLQYSRYYYNNFEQFTKDLVDSYFTYAFTSPFISQENQNYTKQAILDFYFGDGTITQNQNLTDAFTDAMFVSGIDEFIRHRLSGNNSAPTYLYQFQQKGELGQSYAYTDEFQGVCHSDDLFYIFDVTQPTAIPSKRDREVAENMIDLWYNFAAVGTPGPANTDLPRWKAIESYPPQSMRIGSFNDDDSLLELTSNYPISRANFWRELQPYLQPLPQETFDNAFL